jgi:hypothetical protein
MWAPPSSSHIFRGKSNKHRCSRCHNPLGIGERYIRSVIPVRRSRHSTKLIVAVEHENEHDCPYAEFDEMMHGIHEENSIEVAISMVVSQRLVGKLALNGDTIWENEPYIEMKQENTAGDSEQQSYRDEVDSEDEFPF